MSAPEPTAEHHRHGGGRVARARLPSHPEEQVNNLTILLVPPDGDVALLAEECGGTVPAMHAALSEALGDGREVTE